MFGKQALAIFQEQWQPRWTGPEGICFGQSSRDRRLKVWNLANKPLRVDLVSFSPKHHPALPLSHTGGSLCQLKQGVAATASLLWGPDSDVQVTGSILQRLDFMKVFFFLKIKCINHPSQVKPLMTRLEFLSQKTELYSNNKPKLKITGLFNLFI